MSTAARCWWGSFFSRRQFFAGAFLSFGLLWPVFLPAQAQAPAANQAKASQILAGAIQALGGAAWLDLRTMRITARDAAFFQGIPTGTVSTIDISVEFPDKERIDSSKGKVVEMLAAHQGWEITYRGKKPLAEAKLEDFERWKNHSLRAVLGDWARSSTTLMLYQGASIDDRRPVETVALMRSAGESATLTIDAETHLPIRLSFDWRDPRFHDKTRDVIEFDNYHRVDGIATPFTITRKRNGEIVDQRFVEKISYNTPFSKETFDPDVVAAHLR